ncbi:MAG: tetratricopeptide repeat protein, partial [Acidobacteriota bacterium]
MNQDSFIQRLWHRRIPQILGAYVMAGVAVVGFVGLLVERYKLADRVFDAALLAFFTMIPAILLLAYTHGAPGKQAWGRLERFGIPINVAITLVLVVGVLLTETRVEALTETVEVVNVDGSIEEKLRPRAEKRRELAMFFWRNDSGDESLEWLRYGFPILLRRDLEQNPFFDTNSAFSFTTELERADIADALDVPIALAQRISRDHGITYFTDGSFAREGDDWRANLVLYLTETAEPVVTLDATGPTYVEVVDELSIAVRKALDVVDIEELGRDLPVTEHTSVEAIAIEQWIRGNVAQWRDNQAQTAIDSFQKAIEIDPTFALAYSDLAATYSSLGKNTEAIEAASSARKHDYRLNERERLILPIFELVATGHYKKLILVHEQITTLFPTDVSAWRGLAHTYELFGEPVQAIEAYQHVLELDPSEHEVQLEIGRLQSQLGNYEEARQAYQHYVEARPDDASGHMALATTSWFEGDLEETRATFEQARLLTSNPINVDILLAELDGAQGNLEAAERRLNDLSIRVTVPMDRLTVENARIQHYSYLGRYQKGLALSAELHEVLLAVGLPFVADLSVLNYEASTL